jgi:hypothetical protein
VSRHVSPDKLKMLLQANPQAISEVTNDQKTALQLAISKATRSHPNYALIQALKEASPASHLRETIPSNAASLVPTRVSSNDTADSNEAKSMKKRKTKASNRKATKTPAKKRKSSIKREPMTGLEAIETPLAADLLLHFSRSNGTTNSQPSGVNVHATQVAEV